MHLWWILISNITATEQIQLITNYFCSKWINATKIFPMSRKIEFALLYAFNVEALLTEKSFCLRNGLKWMDENITHMLQMNEKLTNRCIRQQFTFNSLSRWKVTFMHTHKLKISYLPAIRNKNRKIQFKIKEDSMKKRKICFKMNFAIKNVIFQTVTLFNQVRHHFTIFI